MDTVSAYGYGGSEIRLDLFGANVLSTRDTLSEHDSVVEIIDQLNVTTVRFPGGSLTEDFFDISDPDSEIGIHHETGEIKNLIPLSDFLEFANSEGLPVTIVIPTHSYLTNEVDQYGNRFPNIDEAELRKFIRDILNGEYGPASIQSFELGNEYWGSGQMNSSEYGALASKMTFIIASEIEKNSEAVNAEPNISIVAQMGHNFGYARLSDKYSAYEDAEVQLEKFNEDYGKDYGENFLTNSGDVNWGKIANQLVLDAFVESGAIHEIDGIVNHFYSMGAEIAGSGRDYFLNMIEETWGQEVDDLGIYLTEWNLKGSTGGVLNPATDYGLIQAHEMLNIIESMVDYNVLAAHAWPLLQNTPNAFSQGFEHSEFSTAGEMFGIMAEVLPGTVPINLNSADAKEDEASFNGYDVHAFLGANEVILIIASTQGEYLSQQLDISALAESVQSIKTTTLGVVAEDVALTGSNQASADIEIEEYASTSLSDILSEGIISIELDPYEIVTVTLGGVDLAPNLIYALEEDQDSLLYKLSDITISSETGDIFGSFGDDTIDSENVGQNIYGLNGDDIIYGGAGVNLIEGGNGNDSLFGGTGADILMGGAGTDKLFGQQGRDLIKGGAQGDEIHSGAGPDEVHGDLGDDLIYGGQGSDWIHGGPGRDTLKGNDGEDTIFGGKGNDIIEGNRGADLLKGNEGNDSIWGGNGPDRIQGNQGNDTLMGSGGNDTLMGGIGNDTLMGGTGNDKLHGYSGADTLAGGRGSDFLHGGAGRDTLSGGPGDDRLIGGSGNDEFVFIDNFGKDVIFDFVSSEDLIILSASAESNLSIEASGDDLIVSVGDNEITLLDTTPSDFGRSDIEFI